MFDDAAWIFFGAGIAAFVAASVSAPIGLLSWWAGGNVGASPTLPPHPPDAEPKLSQVVIYFGGIDVIGGDRHAPLEARFLGALAQRLPQTVLLDTVFPYAASGESLLPGPRVFAAIWRMLAPAPNSTKRPLRAYVINARNLFQVLVAADRRYGPLFAAALLDVVLKALQATGWRAGLHPDLVLVGYSGGAQMAVSVAGLLSRQLAVPIRVLSIGGTIIDTEGLDGVARLFDLTGSSDRLPRITACASSDRWFFRPGSAWARADREGRVYRLELEGMHHRGAGGYFGDAIAPGQQGEPRPNWEVTLAAVCRILDPQATDLPTTDAV